MNTSHFAKITSDMTWQTLYQIILKQKQMNKKQLPYIVIAELHIHNEKFNIIIDDLKRSTPNYLNYSYSSIATLQGVWQCILLTTENHSQNVLIWQV